MDQTAPENGAAADLSRLLQKGSTGRLNVDSRGVDLDVYVMNGAVVAAESTDDIKLLLRRLYAAKVLSRGRVTELGGQADMGESVFGLILEEVRGELMDVALFERFRDNVSRFLGVRAPATFHPMGAVFVENFQMGHDTEQLLLECAKLWRQSRHVPLSVILRIEHTDGLTEHQQMIADRLDGRRSVRQILHDVPLEPVYGRAVLAGMIANGIASKVRSEAAVTDDPPGYEEASTQAGDPNSVPSHPSVSTSTNSSFSEKTVSTAPEVIDSDTYEPTVLLDTSNYSREVHTTEQDLIETEVIEQPVPHTDDLYGSDEVWDDYLGGGLEMLDEPADYRRGLPADTDPDMLDEDSPTVMADYDYSSLRAERQVEPPAAQISTQSAPTAVPNPSSWLSQDFELDDDILDAFADHDHVRGGHEGDGTFTQETLDRVEVADLPEPPTEGPSHEMIEVGEAPTARFGARTLSDEEARNKLDVANDNIGHIVSAFDSASGSGRGRAAVQLLLEGCPTKFAPLFHDVMLRPDGTLPVDRVMRNLHVRPLTEHRQLLNQGLTDLIERGLSIVMDEVEDDDAIDAVLESTAGYRKRIGL